MIVPPSQAVDTSGHRTMETWCHEALNVTANRLVRPAEHPVRGGIEENNPQSLVEGNDGVGRGLNDTREARPALEERLFRLTAGVEAVSRGHSLVCRIRDPERSPSAACHGGRNQGNPLTPSRVLRTLQRHSRSRPGERHVPSKRRGVSSDTARHARRSPARSRAPARGAPEKRARGSVASNPPALRGARR